MFHFFFSDFLFFFIFIFFGNTSLGLARDWDLATPLGLVCVFLLSAVMHKEKPASSTLAVVLLASILYTVPWLVVNILPASSASRFETVLKLDDTHMYKDYALSGYEALRKYYVNQKDSLKDIELSRQKIRILNYPANYTLLLEKLQYFETRDPEKYKQLIMWTLDRLAEKGVALQSVPGGRDYEISLKTIDSLTTAIAVKLFQNRGINDYADRIKKIEDITHIKSPSMAMEAFSLYQQKKFPECTELFQRVLDQDVHLPSLYLFMSSSLGILAVIPNPFIFLNRASTSFLTTFPFSSRSRIIISSRESFKTGPQRFFNIASNSIPTKNRCRRLNGLHPNYTITAADVCVVLQASSNFPTRLRASIPPSCSRWRTFSVTAARMTREFIYPNPGTPALPFAGCRSSISPPADISRCPIRTVRSGSYSTAKFTIINPCARNSSRWDTSTAPTRIRKRSSTRIRNGANASSKA